MIYSIKGKLSAKQENYFVIEVGGVSFKIVSSLNDLRSAPAVGEIVSLFTYLHVREDVLELYGFLYKDELEFFEMLIGISGIGPKSARKLLNEFKTIKNIINTDLEQLEKILGKKAEVFKMINLDYKDYTNET